MLSLHRCKARRLLAPLLLVPLLSVPLLLGWAATAHAQQRLTAQEAVERAWAQAHVHDELEASVDLARSEVVSARTWGNPTLVVEREEPRGDAAASGSETSVMLTQPFELGGQRGLRIRAAEAGVAAAEAGVAHERTRVRAEVLRDYYAAVAAERRMQAHDKIAAGLGSLADVAGKRQRAGDLSGYESRRIAQASAQAQARRAEALVTARAARTRLAGWSGDIALDAVLDAAIELPAVPAAGDLRSVELDALASQRAHAEAQAAAARRVALPVTVGIGTKRTRQGGFSDDALMLEVGVPLPVFDRNQGARARASAELRRVDAQYRRTLVQTRARRSAAWEQARQLTESTRQMQAVLVPEAAQLTAIARNSFAEGELDLAGLLDAYEAEAAVIDHTLEQQARALEAVLELERLSSTPTVSPGPTP